MSTRLTQGELRAACEALGAKLAGELEDNDYPREDYESAHEKLSARVRWKDGENGN